MRILCLFLLLGGQEPDVRKKLRVLDNLEARLAALPPFAADFQFSRTQDGTTTPGSSVSFRVDFPGRAIDVKLTVVDPGAFTRYSTIDQGRLLAWTEGGDGLRGEVGQLFEKIGAACDLCGRELETLLPSTPEHPSMALPRGFSLILHADPRKKADDADGGYRVSVSFPGPPGSWLELVRQADDAVVTERGDQIQARIPSRNTEMVIERATGLPLELTVRDFDGSSRRIARTRYVSGASRPVFPAPDPKKIKPMSEGEKQDYLSAYAAVLDAAARRLRLGWSRLGGREPAVTESISVWAGRYLDLLQGLYVEKTADVFVQERLKAGITLLALERNLDEETREFLALLTQTDALLRVFRDRLEALRAHLAREVADESFLKVLREAFTFERVGAKLSKPDLRDFMRDALKRARQL